MASTVGGGRRRGQGGGSIYRRSDGRWVGSAHLGYLPEGRRRKVVYGRTQAEVRDKLRCAPDPDRVGAAAAGRPDDFRRRFAVIAEKAGLGRWHVHELRHSAASIMLAAGVPLEAVSKVLGHASIRITADVYGHVMDPQRQQAADAMGRVLLGASERS